MGKFVDCNFANADLSDMSISSSTFSNVNFFNVTGLTKEFRCYFTGGIKIHASMLAICL